MKIFLISLQIGVVGTHVFPDTWFQIRYIGIFQPKSIDIFRISP